MILTVTDRKLEFLSTPLTFSDNLTTDIFARKNNLTVARTIERDRYKHLAAMTQKSYPGSLAVKLGCTGRKVCP